MANTTLTPDAVRKLIELNPSLRDQLIATAEAQINEWQQIRNLVAGEAPRRGRRRSKEASELPAPTDDRTHGEAILNVLGKKKDGATSKEIRELLKGTHEMAPNVFHTTLANLRKKKFVKAKGSKGSKIYTAA